MVKAIKIKACGHVSMVEPEEDEDYKAMGERRGGRDSWFLGVPERWEHHKFRLSMTTLGFFTEEDTLNSTATELWNHLRTGGQQPIVGTVFLYNETREDVVDMTMDDFVYIYLIALKRDVLLAVRTIQCASHGIKSN